MVRSSNVILLILAGVCFLLGILVAASGPRNEGALLIGVVLALILVVAYFASRRQVLAAVAGLEIRSSSFLIEQYDKERSEQLVVLRSKLFELRDEIIADFADILPERISQALENAKEENLAELTYRISFRKADERSIALAERLTNIRKLKDKIHKTRDYLSFTPKVEDLYVVHKWIQTYGVPHYYFQVFFDRVYGISFEHILRVISLPDNKGRRFTIERNTKNQFKNTIHINVKEGVEVAWLASIIFPARRQLFFPLIL